MKKGKLYGVGLGPGDPELLTLKAIKCLQHSDVIFESSDTKDNVIQNILATIDDCTAERQTLEFNWRANPKEREQAANVCAKKVIEELEAGKICSYAVIGDPLIFSTWDYLHQAIRQQNSHIDVESISGITSFQAAAATKNFPLGGSNEILSIIPSWEPEFLQKHVLKGVDCIAFLKTKQNRSEMLNVLADFGFKNKGMLASRVGLEGEYITESIQEIHDIPEDYLSVLIMKKGK